MVWQYITFQLLLHKKGTFTYSYSNPGVGRNQKMWCCWSQIAIDYMKFCINPLRLVSVPPPPPPFSPRTSSAPSFPSLVAYHHPVLTLTRGIQGCPKTISLNKNTWHPALKKLLQTSFFSAAWRPYIFATPFAKNALPSPLLNNPRIFSRFFFCRNFFHPFLTNANYLCRRTFWNLPA